MCTLTMKSSSTSLSHIDGRPVLQPPSNRVVPPLDAVPPVKKTLHKSLSMPTSLTGPTLAPDHNSGSAQASPRGTPPLSPTTKPRRPNAPVNDRPNFPRALSRCASMRCKNGGMETAESLWVSGLEFTSPGSIAAAQRERALLAKAQRKSRIERYGRTPEKLQALHVSLAPIPAVDDGLQHKRCGFITPNSDPLYVAYHDEEWGVAVHDDKMLFELLVLAGAQVGLDWTTILKKRNDFRRAFGGFDAEVVSKFNEKHKSSISLEYGLDLGRVRGIVDNACRILEVTREFGSFDKYIWGFVNHKPFNPNYKSSRKVPVKTSKSESISKDMVRRGFRSVGPTVVHTFMQAAGLTNDHIVTCTRHNVHLTT